MKKILLINTVHTGRNGISTVIFNFLQAIQTNSISFDLVSINDTESYYKQIVGDRGGKVFVLDRLHGVLFYWKSLYKLFKKEKYDAVHIHGNSHTLVLELSAAFWGGCKNRIIHAHTTQTSFPIFHKIASPFFHLLYTKGLACGDAAGQWMYGSSEFKVINNGIDTTKFSFNSNARKKVRQMHHFEGCKVIGHVGYFSRVKNHFKIIDVFRYLYNIDTSYRLLLIGDGELRGDIQKLVHNYGLTENVVFVGNIDNVNEYLNAMDITIMPSFYEGLPLTLIEQQSNGLRCIVSDAITREVDKTGNVFFLSLDNNSDYWAKYINDLCIDDECQRRTRSQYAINKIKECGYDINEEAKQLVNFYVDVINN